MDLNPLTNDDVADILALLDSLPYDELDLETPRFRLTLRRTAGGWTQSTQVHVAPEGAAFGGRGTQPPLAGEGIGGTGSQPPSAGDGAGAEEVDEASDAGVMADGSRDGGGDGGPGEDGELVAVAAPFVEVGSRVGADTVIGIVETMKLMNSVPAGVAGVVADFCMTNAEFAAQGAALLRIRADR